MVCRWRGSLASSSAEDGAPKMGAHGAGRAACHASSPEWAVKRPLALSPRCKTTAFLRLFPRFFFFFIKVRVLLLFFCKSRSLFILFYSHTRLLKFAAFAEKKNRITPPSPCTPPPPPLKCVLPCCVASRTVFCCRDRPQVTG